MSDHSSHDALAGCCVISLRPVGQHASLRRAAAAHGARMIALSPWKIVFRDDTKTLRMLAVGLRAARHVLVTSPAAARAANALQPLRARAGQAWYATGTGTAAALRRAGVAEVMVPAAMDSDGLLALPTLREVRDQTVAILTAPGGRDRLLPTLQRRGARIDRIDVYDRVPVMPGHRGIVALRSLAAPPWLALSSGEALRRVLATLPADAAERLRGARVSAASERLAGLARDVGFRQVVVAGDARPASLLEAAARVMTLPAAHSVAQHSAV